VTVVVVVRSGVPEFVVVRRGVRGLGARQRGRGECRLVFAAFVAASVIVSDCCSCRSTSTSTGSSSLLSSPFPTKERQHGREDGLEHSARALLLVVRGGVCRRERRRRASCGRRTGGIRRARPCCSRGMRMDDVRRDVQRRSVEPRGERGDLEERGGGRRGREKERREAKKGRK
jgi:hypothetical protein